MTDFNVNLTDNAVARILVLVKQEPNPEQAMLRISVNGGGCSGFQYKYEFTTDLNEDDKVFEKNGIKLVIDEISGQFMNDAVIDYVDTLSYANFEIKNPNATAGCGCGNSFTV